MNKYSHRRNYSDLGSMERLEIQKQPVLLSGNSSIFERRSSCSSIPSIDTHNLKTDRFNNLINRNPSTDSISKDSDRALSISRFTMAQNEIITNSLQRLDIEVKSQIYVPKIETKKMLRSENDFARLINKLNRVISPNWNKRPLVLHDSEAIEMSVEENQIQYAKIYVRGKKTPMIVKIQRYKGKVMTYMSESNHEPGPSDYSRYYGSDYFEVRENSAVFKYDHVFLGFKAIDDTEARVTVSFGKITDLIELKRIKRQLSQLIPKQILEEESATIEKTHKNLKNFIQLNKSTKFLSSQLNAEQLKRRAEDWKVKHSQIITKKKIILNEKLSKHKNFLNRRVIKLQEEEREKEKQRIMKNKRFFESTWIGLVYIAVSVIEIQKTLVSNRRKKLKKITWNLNAYRIQNMCKEKMMRQMSLKDHQLVRARNSLLLFRENALKLTASNTKYQIFEYISWLAHNHILSHNFMNYIRKTIYIQKNVRMHLAKKQKRIEMLIKIWNQECNFYLFKSSRFKSLRARKSIDIMMIPTTRRNAAIHEYYRDCMIKYRVVIKNYLQSINSLNLQKSISNVVAKFCRATLPPFEFIPSGEQMDYMIEKAMQKIP